MILKPQDIFIMLKLVVRDGSEWSYPVLSYELSMSASEVHAGVKRAVNARLMDMHRKIPVKSNLLEFLIHGVKYAYPPDRGGITRGMATSYAAQPLRELIVQQGRCAAMNFPLFTARFPMPVKSIQNSMNCLHSSMPSAMEGPVKEK
jgi:hypothetical protein